MDILIVFIIIVVGVESDIYINSGILSITNNDACEFTSNGLKFNGTGPGAISGLHFGLISYDCNGVRGLLVSKLSCKECGLYCNYNQVIEGCQNFWVPFFFGASIVLVIFFFSLIWTRRWIYRLIIYVTEEIMYAWTRCHDKREINKIDKLIARNVRGVEPIFRRPINKDAKFINKLNNKRIVNTYIEIELEDIKQGSKMTFVEPSAPETEQTKPQVPIRNNRYPSLTSLKSLAIGTLIVTTAPPVIDCCDNTLYISSLGKICDSTHCSESKMYDMPLITGSITCFKDLEGNMMKIKIAESYWRSRYNLLYKTSDVQLDIYQTWSCKNSGSCLSGNCEVNSVNPVLLTERNGTINGYGCLTDGLGCDTWCFHGLSCNWHKWSMTSISPIYSVYQKHSEL